VLRRIFASKRDAVTGGWRTVHSGELDVLRFLRNVKVTGDLKYAARELIT
jgi:hypothetical protein